VKGLVGKERPPVSRRQLHGELADARETEGGDLAERSAGDTGGRVVPVAVVHHVEEVANRPRLPKVPTGWTAKADWLNQLVTVRVA